MNPNEFSYRNKVINEHSTIGVVVTTDGSITDIDREDYVEAENRVIKELKGINKPFVVLMNTTDPSGDAALRAKEEIEARHGVSVLPVNCAELDANDINNIIEKIDKEIDKMVD